MNETIIIDCSSRLWLAGVATPTGCFITAPVEFAGIRNPYLWAEILLDRDRYECPDEEFLARLAEVPAEGEDSGRELGWYLDGGEQPERVVTLKDPLRVLSEPYAASGQTLMVRLAGIKLLKFLLNPLVIALRRLGTDPEKRSAVVVTPAFLGRMGMLCLLSALRCLGVRRPRLLPRSFALGLYAAFVVGAEESISVDSDEEGLTLRRAKGRLTTTSAALTLTHSQELEGNGWPNLLDLLRMEEPAWSPRALRKAIFGVGSAPPSPGLSWNDMAAYLRGGGGEKFRESLKVRLVQAAEHLGWPEAGLVMSGLCFMVPGGERIARGVLGAGEPFDNSLAVERPSRGVAAMTGWLSAKSGRTVELHRADTVFIEVGGQVHRVLPADVLGSLNGRQREFRRLGLVSIPEGLDRGVLGVHVVQGVGDARRDRVSVGILTQELALEGMAFEAELAVTLLLKRGGRSARVRGTMRVDLEQMAEEVPLRFVKSELVFTSGIAREDKMIGDGDDTATARSK